MVALRRLPRDLPPPLDDGRPARSVHSYDRIKMHLWGGIVNASATAMKNKWSGRRACIDLFASYGLNRITDTGELCWGSSLLALHADAGFDTYIFCYALALIDPPSLSFWWESLAALTFNERMDLTLLFAEGMDLNRNLDRYAAKEQSKLDRFFGTTEWRELLSARRPTIALREFYKDRMRSQLGYEAFASYDRPVRNSKHAELYKLIYASKIKLGSDLWDKVNKDEPDGQISLIV